MSATILRWTSPERAVKQVIRKRRAVFMSVRRFPTVQDIRDVTEALQNVRAMLRGRG